MIRHLNCATFAPVLLGRMVAHVLLVEREEGLLLVDTGFGTADLANPRRLGAAFVRAMRPRLAAAETALAQVEALGYRAEDVTDVVLTHLDLDHAGGVGDFPHARVHVHAAELDAARHPSGTEHGRYVEEQWRDARFVTHDHARGGEAWRGLEAVPVVGDDVLLVPLHGHTRGHTAVAVRETTADGDRWLLHAGDAYMHAGDLADPPSSPRTLRGVQRLLAQDDRLRRANLERLRELAARDADVVVFSAHDAAELEAFSH